MIIVAIIINKVDQVIENVEFLKERYALLGLVYNEAYIFTGCEQA